MQDHNTSSLYKKAIITFLAVIILDQVIKFYIKTNFSLNEYVNFIPNFFEIRFVENPGMAFGWKLPGEWGKILLTSFRVVAVMAIGYYLNDLIKKRSPKGLIICVSLILAGAVGNIIDSAIYGVIFSESTVYQIAEFMPEQSYGRAMMGSVVDMFQFTLRWPDWEWFPWRGRMIFPPIFNLADAAISTGVIFILLKQKKYFIEQDESKIQSDSEEKVQEENTFLPQEK